MYQLLHPSLEIGSTAAFLVLSSCIGLFLRYKKQPKNIWFWLILVLDCSVIAVAAFIYFLGPYKRLLLFYLLVLFIILTCVFWLLAIGPYKEDPSTMKTDNFGYPVSNKKRMYSLAVTMLMSFIFTSSTIYHVFPDVPRSLSGDFSVLDCKIEADPADDYMGFFSTNENSDTTFYDLQASSSDYAGFEKDVIYHVKYLPHSQYVVDILDANGKSMLRR